MSLFDRIHGTLYYETRDELEDVATHLRDRTYLDSYNRWIFPDRRKSNKKVIVPDQKALALPDRRYRNIRKVEAELLESATGGRLVGTTLGSCLRGWVATPTSKWRCDLETWAHENEDLLEHSPDDDPKQWQQQVEDKFHDTYRVANPR